MTIEEFKEKLPNLIVRVAGADYIGIPKGRTFEFCQVITHRADNQDVPGPTFKASWQAITRCYNENRKLTY